MALILEFHFWSFMRPSGCWSLSQQNKWSSPACPLEEQNGEKRRSLSHLTGEGYKSDLPGAGASLPLFSWQPPPPFLWS